MFPRAGRCAVVPGRAVRLGDNESSQDQDIIRVTGTFIRCTSLLGPEDRVLMAKRLPKLVAFDLEFVPNAFGFFDPQLTYVAIPSGPCGLIATLMVSVVDQAGHLRLANIGSWL